MNKNVLFSVLSACIGSYHFGYHLAELNGPKSSLQCQSFFQDNCIEMTDYMYSFATAIFAIGGFGGTLLGSFLHQFGRRPQLLLSAVFIVLGSAAMAFSTLLALFIIGRFVVGLGGGLALLNTPVYINEQSPMELRGKLGTFSQFAITIGIFIASLMGYLISDWRFIVGLPLITGCLQFIAVFCCKESPKYVFMQSGDRELTSKLLSRLRPHGHDLDGEMNSWHQKTETSQVSFKQFLQDKVYIKLLIGLVAAHSSMQLTGINVVFFYSVTILKDLFGEKQAAFFSLIIALYNIFSTMLASVFIERLGRKKLLLISIAWLSLSQLGLTFSLYYALPELEFIFFISIVTGFSVGLSVIPFILIGELFDGSVVNYANSIANPVNWASNFLVSFGFIPLTAILKEFVFLIFVGYGIFCFIIMFKYIPETKGLSPLELQAKLRSK